MTYATRRRCKGGARVRRRDRGVGADKDAHVRGTHRRSTLRHNAGVEELEQLWAEVLVRQVRVLGQDIRCQIIVLVLHVAARTRNGRRQGTKARRHELEHTPRDARVTHQRHIAPRNKPPQTSTHPIPSHPNAQQKQVAKRLRWERRVLEEEVQFAEASSGVLFHVHKALVVERDRVKLVLSSRRHVTQSLLCCLHILPNRRGAQPKTKTR